MDMSQQQARFTAWVHGRVQGVGFRFWVRARALELGLSGSATNLDDGRVQVVAQGQREACEQLVALLRDPVCADRPGHVTGVVERWAQPHAGMDGFVAQ